MTKKILKFISKHFFKILSVIGGLIACYIFRGKNEKTTGKIEVTEIEKINYGRTENDTEKDIIDNPITDSERESFLKGLRKKK